VEGFFGQQMQDHTGSLCETVSRELAQEICLLFFNYELGMFSARYCSRETSMTESELLNDFDEDLCGISQEILRENLH
jgi:hypothetical protein